MNPVLFTLLSLTVVFILYQVVGGVLTLLATGTDIGNADVNLTRLVTTVAQFMFLLAPAIVLVMLRKGNIAETMSMRAPDMKVLGLAIAGIIVVQPFLQLFIYLQNGFIFSLPLPPDLMNTIKEFLQTLDNMTLRLVKANSPLELFTVIIVIAVTPAICEEFLFRGLVFGTLKEHYSPIKAVVVTGILFAAFHFHPFNLIPLILLGIYLTYIVYKSGSIVTGMVCHLLNNLFAALAAYYLSPEYSSSEMSLTPDERTQLIIAGIVSLVIFSGIIYLISKNGRQAEV